MLPMLKMHSRHLEKTKQNELEKKTDYSRWGNVTTGTEGKFRGATHVLKGKNRSKGAQKYSNVSKKKNPPEIKEGLNL